MGTKDVAQDVAQDVVQEAEQDQGCSPGDGPERGLETGLGCDPGYSSGDRPPSPASKPSPKGELPDQGSGNRRQTKASPQSRNHLEGEEEEKEAPQAGNPRLAGPGPFLKVKRKFFLKSSLTNDHTHVSLGSVPEPEANINAPVGTMTNSQGGA